MAERTPRLPNDPLPSFEELLKRVEQLEAAPIQVKDLPIRALQSVLETDWQPSAGVLLGANSVGNAVLVAGQRVSDEFTVNSGSLASGVESAQLDVTHKLGVIPSIVIGHLEDGTLAHQFGWKVVARTATLVSFRLLNHGPSTGTAILRFRLFY